MIVVAHGLSSQQEDSAKFTLADQADGSASSGTSGVVDNPADLTITYQGSGYLPGERVSAWFQYPSERGGELKAHALPDVSADASGNVSFAFTVGSDWEFGQYHITAEGAQSKQITYNTFSYFGTISSQEIYSSGTSISGSVSGGTWYGQYFRKLYLHGNLG